MALINGTINGGPLGATRVHGDAYGVVNVNIGLAGDNSANVIIATGLTKEPTVYKIIANVAAGTGTLDMGVGSSVESILRYIQESATIVMYQVGLSQLNVMVEAQGFGSDANVLAAVTAGNINTAANSTVTITSLSSANGFLLA